MEKKPKKDKKKTIFHESDFKSDLQTHYDLNTYEAKKSREDDLETISNDVENRRLTEFFKSVNGEHGKYEGAPKSYILKKENKRENTHNLLEYMTVEHIRKTLGDDAAESYAKNPDKIRTHIDGVLAKYGGSYQRLFEELRSHTGSVRKLLKNPNSLFARLVADMPEMEHDETRMLNYLTDSLIEREKEGKNLYHAHDFLHKKSGKRVKDYVNLAKTLGHLEEHSENKSLRPEYLDKNQDDFIDGKVIDMEPDYQKGNKDRQMYPATKKT